MTPIQPVADESDKSPPKSAIESTKRIVRISVLCVLLLLVADVLVPVGVATYLANVLVVLFAMSAPGNRHVLLVAVISTASIIVGGVISIATDDIIWVDLLNRGIVAGTIWAIATIAVVARGHFAETSVLVQKQSDQMLRNQKLESLGILATAVAHDFKNMLTGVLGNADLLKREIDAGDPSHVRIEAIQQATMRAADLANQMLAYSAREDIVIKPLSINVLIEEMAHFLGSSVSKNAALSLNFADELPLINGDVAELKQMIMNLVTNASEAIGETPGVITLSTGIAPFETVVMRQEKERTTTWQLTDTTEIRESCVFLTVEDNGCGMKDDAKERIFEPFFSTKLSGRGLGLAATLAIVKEHKGAIGVASGPQQGTAISACFPPSGTQIMNRLQTTTDFAETLQASKQTILFVDDEKMIRTLCQDMLNVMGHDVISAASGEEALDLYRTHGSDIHVVLLDMTMPGMTGIGTFKELKAIDDEAKVVLCSGFSEEEFTSQITSLGFAGFIQKPFSMKELADKLEISMFADGHGRDGALSGVE